MSGTSHGRLALSYVDLWWDLGYRAEAALGVCVAGITQGGSGEPDREQRKRAAGDTAWGGGAFASAAFGGTGLGSAFSERTKQPTSLCCHLPIPASHRHQPRPDEAAASTHRCSVRYITASSHRLQLPGLVAAAFSHCGGHSVRSWDFCGRVKIIHFECCLLACDKASNELPAQF